MGDLSQVIPVLHPYMGGARGAGLAADYEIVGPHLASVMPARAMAATVVDLLWDGAWGPGGGRERAAGDEPRELRRLSAVDPPPRGLPWRRVVLTRQCSYGAVNLISNLTVG